jgi:F0F1-type ATP synthase assembly protein I
MATDPQPPKPAGSPFRGAAAGYLPVSGALLGFGGGYLLDRAYGTLPWWTLGLGVLMTAAGFYHLLKEFRR